MIPHDARRQIRVLHAAETIKGGVATVIDQLCTIEGVEASVLVPESQSQELAFTGMVNTFRRSGRNIASLIRFVTALMFVVMRTRPDIVHLHSSFAGTAGRCFLPLLRPFRKFQIIYCPHAFSFMMVSSRPMRVTVCAIEKMLARLCSRIICVSRFEFDAAVGHGLPRDKLVVVRNGASRPSESSDIPCPFSAEARTRVLFVGRFDYQKGFDVLLRAMERVEGSGIELLAVGGGVHSEFEGIGGPNTSIIGWVPRSNLSGYFKAADVLVMPSRWEGFPMVGIEAFSYGLPVLGARASSIPELLDEDCGLLFDAEDDTALAKLLEETPISVWRRLGRNAERKFVREFQVDRVQAETAAVYQTALGLTAGKLECAAHIRGG